MLGTKVEAAGVRIDAFKVKLSAFADKQSVTLNSGAHGYISCFVFVFKAIMARVIEAYAIALTEPPGGR